MARNIIIYGTTRTRANDKLHEILNNLNRDEIERIIQSIYSFTILMKNGDYYRAVQANDNVRGYRWQYAYIDKEIKNEVLHTVVLPKHIPERNNNGEYIEKEWNEVCEYFW